MNKIIESEGLRKSCQPLYRQVVNMLEEQIYANRLRPGDRLPTTQELSRQTGLAKNTVQQALTLLTERGLLERVVGRGTFVSNRVHASTIAVVTGLSDSMSLSTFFFSLLRMAFRNRLNRSGWAAKFFFPADGEDCGKMLFDLERDIENGEVRGVLVLCPTNQIIDWMRKGCGVPCVDCDALSSVGDEAVEDGEVYRGLAYLASLGKKRVALLTGDNRRERFDAALEALRQGPAPDLAMECFLSDDIEESGGYRLYREAVHPRLAEFDALFVTNDFLCKGVMFGLRDLGVEVPRDVALLTHANKGIEILSPVPLTRLEADPDEYAACAMEHIMAGITGRGTERRLELPKLIIGKSCGE